MSAGRLLVGSDSLRKCFHELCDWAEWVSIVSSQIEANCWALPVLQRNRRKLEQVLVPEGSTSGGMHSLLQDVSALRWVSLPATSFGASLHVFQNGTAVAVLLGGPRFSNVAEGIETGALFEGSEDETFSCHARNAIEELRARARVPLGIPQEQSRILIASPTLQTPEGLSDAPVTGVTLLIDETEIRAARESLMNSFRAGAVLHERRFSAREGVVGAIHWHDTHQIWAAFGLGASRYFKVFGTESPSGLEEASPVTEINMPVRGIDRRCIGGFARDPETGQTYLIHRARVGQGVTGALAFWRSSRLRGVSLDEGNGPDGPRVALVAALGSAAVVEQVSAFIRELARVEAADRHQSTGLGEERQQSHFGDERSRTSFLDLDEGERVDALHDCLLGVGALEKDQAVRECGKSLKESGMVEFSRLRSGGDLYDEILASLDRGVRSGIFDRPRRNHVRAIWRDVDSAPDHLWDVAMNLALREGMLDREEAIRECFAEAKELFGPDAQVLRSGGRVETAIKSAIRRGLKRGDLIAEGSEIGLPSSS